MQTNTFKKEYLAILEGYLEPHSGTINAPISRKFPSIIERHVDENGALAITNYKVISQNNNLSLVKFSLKTGRTHQLRVHSSYIKHPILGDSLYGFSSVLIDRQALHCCFLQFIHPFKKEIVEYSSTTPNDIKFVIKKVNL